ncbi:MAG: Isoleucyl-tRNA synthetase, isoleucyl-tRNA synthetase [Candidatus Nomurabacteria bacterium]|nr:Isoleucyl-tRNA synthetase, isoleucyl-tRNA synthetase [Candidatus Nomurabacteria bacterium]
MRENQGGTTIANIALVLGKQPLVVSQGRVLFLSMQEPNKQKTISEKEKEVLAFWNENNIFGKSLETPAGDEPRGDFSFYDGPPFATGLPHYGHILQSVVKDAVPRYQTMNGKRVRRVWGWDCHGLPIENLIEKKLNLNSKKDIEEFGIDKFNRDAYESVLKYEEEWRGVIPRLGRWVDMDHPYKTMDATYTESIWWAWNELWKKGLAYEGFKMMHICPRCETPLAQSEVGLEYHDVTDISVTAKFELTDEPGTFILAWTTTPWTLPGNTALALHKDADYEKVKVDGMEGIYILAKERVEEVLKDHKYEVVDTFKGEKLLGKSYLPVFPYFKDTELENKENIWKTWHADFITLDTGTGIAHEAPAFGAEDMELAKQNNIPIIKHVTMDGRFISEVTDFAQMKVKQVNDTQSADIEIIKYLAHHGLLFEKHKIIHSYPLCWRCKTPLIQYATSSWFVDVPKMKDKLLEENSKIGWTPEHVRDGRFGKWLEGAREWAVSRARYWGAPLPVWKCEECEKIKVIGSLEELSEGREANNKYFIMRHGEAISNQNGVIDCSGDPNNHLTENGRSQAEKVKEALNEKIDLIVASPFLRTKETAEIVSKSLGGIEIIEEERLKEFNLGVFDKRPISDYHGTFKEINLDSEIKDGETHRELMKRVMSAWYDLEKKYKGKNILIITHGGPGWMLSSGVTLRTDSDINNEMINLGPGDWMPNAVARELVPKVIPRDETGVINLHRPYIDDFKFTCDCGGEMKRIPDVFDCWFESGSMPFASIHYPFENKDLFDTAYPADFIGEAMDQTRGWFYSLLNLGVGLFNRAPYKHVIVTGWVMAKSGAKLSKREGNYTDPMVLIEKYGADAIRYALISSPLVKGENVEFDDENVSSVYKKLISRLENVVSLYEMNKIQITSPLTSDAVIDKWILSRIHEVIKSATLSYDSYKIDEAVRPLEQLIDDLSVWYVRRSRSRLKGDDGEDEQKNAYVTLTYVLLELSKVMAPVMPFISERIYKAVGGEKESVHLESWPKGGEVESEIISEMQEVRDVVSQALMERTKSKISVRQPLQTLTTIKNISVKYHQLIKEEVNVKEIIVGSEGDSVVSLDLNLTEELKKEGDVRELIRAIQDKRKEMGLSPKDKVILTLQSSFDDESLDDLKKICNISEIKITQDELKNKVEVSSGEISFEF